MTFLSMYEQANAGLREAAVKRAQEGLTPAHTAAAAGLDGGEHDDDEAEAEQVQHFADPFGGYQVVPDEVKAYRDAASLGPPEHREGTRPFASLPGEVTHPPAHAHPPVAPGAFRKGPLTEGQAAVSPGYQPPGLMPLTSPCSVMPGPVPGGMEAR